MAKGRKRKYEPIIKLRLPDELEGDKIAITRDLAKEQLQVAEFMGWSAIQRKIFAIMLMNIKWKEKGNSNVVQIKNSEAMELLGRHLEKAERNIGVILRDEISHMVTHSGVRLQDPYNHKYYTGNLLFEVSGDSVFTNVTLNPLFMPHFEQLYETKAFITMLGTDMVSFDSVYSFHLYQHLRLYCKTGGAINSHFMTTKQLKELFGLGQYDYMRRKVDVTADGIPLDENWNADDDNRFDRYGFEQRVLLPAIRGINKSEMVEILAWEDGKFFRKEKERGKVTGYRFKYVVYEDDFIKKQREKNLLMNNSTSSNICREIREENNNDDEFSFEIIEE